MHIYSVIVLAIGVAMDCFIVSICKGAEKRNVSIWDMIVVGLWFGGFHFFMPILGGVVGGSLDEYIQAVHHWIVFAVLGIIGGKMMYEALVGSEHHEITQGTSPRIMLPLQLAMSLDAFAVGASLAQLADILIISQTIGMFTFMLSVQGLKLGSLFGTFVGRKALFTGGFVIFMIGLLAVFEQMEIIDLFRRMVRIPCGPWHTADGAGTER